MMRARVLRYALAPACILLAALFFRSPAGPVFSLAGLFVFAVLAAAWFGGVGPGLLAALLATFTLPQLVTVSYPLLGGFLDLPRFITFSVEGLAVGWWSFRQRRVVAALRDQERYARVMNASDDGLWDWIVAVDTIYASPRLLELFGFAPGATFAGRDDFVARIPFHPEDRPLVLRGLAEHLAGRTARHEVQSRFLTHGETRWAHIVGVATRDPSGAVVRWTGTVRDITEAKRADQALRESEERYALAMEAAGDGHIDWNLLTGEHYIAPRLLQICGYPPGTTFRDRAEWLQRFPFHPEDRPKWEQAIAAHFAGHDSHFKTELRIKVGDDVRWTALHFVSKRDAAGTPIRWTGAISDITEHKRIEAALRLSEERYALAIAASESGYWDWHIPSGDYFASPRALDLAGFPPGTTFVTRDEYRARINMHPDDFVRWEAAREALFAGTDERLSMEVRYMVRGEPRWHILHAICSRDDTGKVVRWAGSATDITDRKLAEDELRAVESKLRLAQHLEAMGTLAGGISHDFNNILGAILGYGEMALRDAPKGSRLARDLDSIMIAGERGRALVDRVLAFSRSAVGERVPVHVEKVVREALDLVSAKLPPSVTLRATLRAGRATLLGDATQVHQVVDNLATNAVHAMPQGGTVRVSLDAVAFEAARATTVGALAAGEYLVLAVADSGSGIAPDILDRIFDPFFTTKEAGSGTGLGLSLVHGIVTELGGGIDVASSPGRGSTTFAVYLPRSGDVSQFLQGEEPEMPRGDGQRVLVVDDEEPLVELATRTLEALGYSAAGFTSSAAALSAFRAEPERFQALITDERMPGMTGSALIREVRGIHKSIPIVLMSGFAGGPVLRNAREAGADEVLKKPLSARDLANSLARVLHS